MFQLLVVLPSCNIYIPAINFVSWLGRTSTWTTEEFYCYFVKWTRHKWQFFILPSFLQRWDILIRHYKIMHSDEEICLPIEKQLFIFPLFYKDQHMPESNLDKNWFGECFCLFFIFLSETADYPLLSNVAFTWYFPEQDAANARTRTAADTWEGKQESARTRKHGNDATNDAIHDADAQWDDDANDDDSRPKWHFHCPAISRSSTKYADGWHDRWEE